MPTVSSAPAILYIDDDADSRDMYGFAFRQAGWHVTTLSGGAAALQFLKVFQPLLVITDIRMEQITGYDLCRAMRDDPRTRGIPVMALTALPLRAVDERGFARVMSKPCTPEDLISAAEGVLGAAAPLFPRAKRAAARAKMLRTGVEWRRKRRPSG